MMATVVTEDLECCGGSVGGGSYVQRPSGVGLGYLFWFDRREGVEARRGNRLSAKRKDS